MIRTFPWSQSCLTLNFNCVLLFSWRNKKKHCDYPLLSGAMIMYRHTVNTLVSLFVCVEVLQPSQPNGVTSSLVSLPNHTFTGQALSSKRLTSIVHIPWSETDNCPSWISGRERMTVENISWSISTKECCRPPGLQSDGASKWAAEAGP